MACFHPLGLIDRPHHPKVPSYQDRDIRINTPRSPKEDDENERSRYQILVTSQAQWRGRCWLKHLVCLCVCVWSLGHKKGARHLMSAMLPFLLTAPEATEANCCRRPTPTNPDRQPTDSLHPPPKRTASTLPHTGRARCHTQGAHRAAVHAAELTSQPAATFPDPQLPVRLTFPVQA